MPDPQPPESRYMEECYHSDPLARETSTDVYTHYLYWCDRTGHVALGPINFGKALKELGFHVYRTGRGRFYRGIRLRHDVKDMFNV